MKILQVHNFYKIGGGEDTVVSTERALLERKGHEVFQYYKYNSEIDNYGSLDKVKLLKRTTFNKETYREVIALIKKTEPAVCHVHNFLPLISPSIFKACRDSNVPVVQTLHNYRLMCTNGILYRNDRICEDCLGKSAYKSVKYGCYRHSTAQTYAVARMLEKNKSKGVWNNQVNAYICLTQFAKEKFIEHGIPEERLLVKGNFILDKFNKKKGKEMPYFVFVGRLEKSKGIEILMRIAKKSPFKIKVIGEGDYAGHLLNFPQVEYLGKLSNDETLEVISQAKALIFPSLWYEGMPMTILEAFSLKTVVIASDLGAIKSMIKHKETGLLFDPHHPKELVKLLNWSVANITDMAQISERAHKKYKALYSAEGNYKQLMNIYNHVIQSKTT